MRKKAREIRSFAGNDNIQAVSDWRQIEAGVLLGEVFKPQALADEFERRAADGAKANK